MLKSICGVVALTACLAVTSPVLAAPFEQEIFNHKMKIVSTNAENDKLIVDGRIIYSERFIRIVKIGSLNSYGYAVSDSTNGGNICDSQNFVVVFKPDGAVRLDGPTENCNSIAYSTTATGLLFETVATAEGKGERRTWTPETGFSSPVEIAFQAENKGWGQVLDGTLNHPLDVYENRTITEAINARAGKDADQFRQLVDGTGSVRIAGKTLFGTTCISHQRRSGGAFFAADTDHKKVYIAWKPLDQLIKVSPVIKDWPKEYRVQLKAWADGFQ